MVTIELGTARIARAPSEGVRMGGDEETIIVAEAVGRVKRPRVRSVP